MQPPPSDPGADELRGAAVVPDVQRVDTLVDDELHATTRVSQVAEVQAPSLHYWSCPSCTFLNHPDLVVCEACECHCLDDARPVSLLGSHVGVPMPVPWSVALFGERLLTKSGIQRTANVLAGKKNIGVYFAVAADAQARPLF